MTINGVISKIPRHKQVFADDVLYREYEYKLLQIIFKSTVLHIYVQYIII